MTKLSDEGFRVTKELDGILDTRGEKGVELITAPLDAMLDLIREVSERAHGNGLLRWIL